MAQSDFFPARPDVNPQIYAYRDPNYPGQLKVGYTATNVQRRVAEQYPTKRPGDALPYSIEYQTCSMREDGTYFMDKAVHRWLRRHGKENTGGEWFRCTVADVKAAVVALKNGEDNEAGRTETFAMPPNRREPWK